MPLGADGCALNFAILKFESAAPDRSLVRVVIERFDKHAVGERAERLGWIMKVFPRVSGFGTTIEGASIFTEAKMILINGEFVATTLLASAFLEHLLGAYIEAHGFTKEAQEGLAAIVACPRKHGLVDEYILGKTDSLRQIRNPYVHRKPDGHRYGLTQRMRVTGSHFWQIMEKDAREALIVMYSVVGGKLR